MVANLKWEFEVSGTKTLLKSRLRCIIGERKTPRGNSFRASNIFVKITGKKHYNNLRKILKRRNSDGYYNNKLQVIKDKFAKNSRTLEDKVISNVMYSNSNDWRLSTVPNEIGKELQDITIEITENSRKVDTKLLNVGEKSNVPKEKIPSFEAQTLKKYTN